MGRRIFSLRGRKRKRHGSLLSFFVGRVILSCDKRYSTELLNLCLRHSISYGDLELSQNERILLSLSYSAAKKLQALCRAYGITTAIDHSSGIREMGCFLLKRPGLPIGVLLSVLVAVVSSTHLWEIRVTGNSVLSKSEVITELSEAGLSLFDYVPRVDVDSIENRLLLKSERISWISVNLIGNVAEVQIREKTIPEDVGDSSPANLVAECDGVIVSVEVLRGNILIRSGQAVRAGEVLVSGVYDSLTQGIRYTRAEGKIYAETERAFEIRVPYRYEKESFTEESGIRYNLHLFGREFKLYESESYDNENVSERMIYLSVFGKPLPIGFSVLTSHTVKAETGEYTRDRAMEIAYHRLKEKLLSLSEMQGILEKKLSYEIGEDAYTLHCTVRCIENIAKTQNIEVVLFE